MLGSQFPRSHTVSVIKQTHGGDGGREHRVQTPQSPQAFGHGVDHPSSALFYGNSRSEGKHLRDWMAVLGLHSARQERPQPDGTGVIHRGQQPA